MSAFAPAVAAETVSTESLSLYLHIPFCRHRCSYCDFNTYTSLGDLQPAYAVALADEVRQVAGGEKRLVHTLFFGGGTPSLMTPAQMETILGRVYDSFDVATAAEVSMEANPQGVDRAYFSAMRALGVNRLSFGVQSVQPDELALLERRHDFDGAIRALEEARAAGFGNINIDLIYGVPGQTLASWQASVRAVLALEPMHVSLYCLTIEPGTPMQRWLHSGQMQAPDPDLAADQYAAAGDLMGAAGFVHYEISNWARPGHACEHNLTYWRNGEYLGLGAGAHGHAAGLRYYVVKQPRAYLRRVAQGGGSYPLSSAVAGSQFVTRADRLADTAITRLRLLEEGIPLDWFTATFGDAVENAYGPALAELIDWGLLTKSDRSLRLTERGRFLSNQVFQRLI